VTKHVWPLAKVASVALVLLAGPLMTGSSAQVATPFPRAIMAFPPSISAETGQPELAIRTVAAADAVSGGSAATRAVTVGFASSFALPSGRYRVSIVVGDPTGVRRRASLVSVDGAASGTVETSSDGRTWTPNGAIRATFDADSTTIEVPVGEAVANAALWAEAELGTDTAKSTRSPAYALGAVLGQSTDGRMPGSSWSRQVVPGEASPRAGAPFVAIPGSPPTVSVDNQALVVDETSSPPARVAGQAVVEVIDAITFMPTYSVAGTIPAVIDINRTTGAVLALQLSSGAPVDRSGDSKWLISGLSPIVPGAPGEIVIDLEKVAAVLGFGLDPDALGIGLQRTVTLANGAVMMGAAVHGTLGWFQGASVPVEAAPPSADQPSAAAPADHRRPALVVGSIAMALVLAGLVAIGLRRRRPGTGSVSRAGHDSGQSPDAALAGLDAKVGELVIRVDQLGSPPGASGSPPGASGSPPGASGSPPGASSPL
jgi:hypothetical protein